MGTCNAALLLKFRMGGSRFMVAIFGGLEHKRRYEEQYQFYAIVTRAGDPIGYQETRFALRALRKGIPKHDARVECDGDQWLFYGMGNFLFNASGRYAAFHVTVCL